MSVVFPSLTYINGKRKVTQPVRFFLGLLWYLQNTGWCSKQVYFSYPEFNLDLKYEGRRCFMLICKCLVKNEWPIWTGDFSQSEEKPVVTKLETFVLDIPLRKLLQSWTLVALSKPGGWLPLQLENLKAFALNTAGDLHLFSMTAWQTGQQAVNLFFLLESFHSTHKKVFFTALKIWLLEHPLIPHFPQPQCYLALSRGKLVSSSDTASSSSDRG